MAGKRKRKSCGRGSKKQRGSDHIWPYWLLKDDGFTLSGKGSCGNLTEESHDLTSGLKDYSICHVASRL